MVLKNQKGQTMVEYMLLLTVAISLVLTFFRSDAFKRLFGEGGSLGVSIKNETEMGYRHAFMKPGFPDPQGREEKDGSNHPSYSNPDGSGSRFFGARLPYGE